VKPARSRSPRRPTRSISPADSARARADLDAFIAKFTPEIGALVRSVISATRARLRGGFELVYDNYYALVVGYGPTARPSEAIFSIVARPKHVSLCFLQGVRLVKAGGDPKQLLAGGGHQVRNLRIGSAALLRRRDVRALITRAVAMSKVRFDQTKPITTVVRMQAARQWPRRPGVAS